LSLARILSLTAQDVCNLRNPLTNLAYSTQLKTDGNYEIFQDGARIATGTKSVADSYLSQNAPAPTPAPTPTNRTVDNPASDPAVMAAESYVNTFKAPESYDDIYERKRKSVQGLIDNTNKIYDETVASSKARGEERLSERGAMNIVSGIAGSPRAYSNRDKVSVANDKEVEAVNNERATKLAEIYYSLEKDAQEEARNQVLDARSQAEGILKRDGEKQTKALDSIKNMAASGLVDFDAFKSNPANKSVYDYALRSFGGSEEALKGFISLNRPEDTILTEGTIGNKYYRVTRHPITGKVTNETFDLGFEIPPEYEHVQMGDELVFFPKGKSIAEAFADGSAYSYKAAQTEEDKLRIEGLRLDNDRKRADRDNPETKTRDTSVQEFNGKKYLIDNQTGETIKELGAGEGEGIARNGPIKPNTLTDLLVQYRSKVENSSQVGRYFKQDTKKELASLRGQITATYKQEKKLGTLDAGVQKLIEGIIGSETSWYDALNPVPNKASEGGIISGVDSFLKNEGGVDLSDLPNLRSQVGKNEVLVIDRETRTIGAIPQDEFTADKYIKL
jgi:hypothetical protein